MTPQQYAAMKPGDTVLVRASVFPRGRNHPADGDAGDHIKIEIVGGGVLWVPLAQIAGVLHPAEDAKYSGGVDAGSCEDQVIASLCGPHGRAAIAA